MESPTPSVPIHVDNVFAGRDRVNIFEINRNERRIKRTTRFGRPATSNRSRETPAREAGSANVDKLHLQATTSPFQTWRMRHGRCTVEARQET
jgi:hypothetical protein